MKNRVGLGTFPLAGVFSPISKQESVKIVQSFVDSGGFYIDTAPLYGFGMVEDLIGEALNHRRRQDYFLITKCGYIDVEGKSFQTVKKSAKAADVIGECEKSLRRLKTDYIDLYFLHSPDPSTPPDETMEAMEKLQRDGKVRQIGVSNVSLEELEEFNRHRQVSYIQNRFSLLNRSINGPFAEYLDTHSIKLIPYQVIDRGQLTGKILENLTDMASGDLRIGRSDWLPEKVNIISDWVKCNLNPIAESQGITIGQLSMAWALHQEFMGFLIVGLTNPDYIPINLAADSIKLDPGAISKIDGAYRQLEMDIRSKFSQTVREFRGLNEKFY